METSLNATHHLSGKLFSFYIFEVNPLDPENEMSRTPIYDMGRFSHEAGHVDPSTGIWYLTEDASPSFFYRFTPHDRSQTLGSLEKGGILEATAIDELPRSSANGNWAKIWGCLEKGKP